MFIVDYFGFKHIKYSNVLHILTFYTTPKEVLKISLPPILLGAIHLQSFQDLMIKRYGVSIEFEIVRYEQAMSTRKPARLRHAGGFVGKIIRG